MGLDKDRWRTSNTCVYNIGYHIIFCTKYRRKFLAGAVGDRAKELFREKCEELEVDLESIEVMPEHVHMFVKTKPSIAPQYVVSQTKGYVSRKLREEFPELRGKAPVMWTRSFYVESVGHISVDAILKYIADQKNTKLPC